MASRNPNLSETMSKRPIHDPGAEKMQISANQQISTIRAVATNKAKKVHTQNHKIN
jgi:hypothetical protein